MGKVKVRTLGVENEEAQKNEQKKKKEEKKLAKVAGKGGERVVVVGATEEDLAKTEQKAEPQAEEKKTKKEKFQRAKHIRSKSYTGLVAMVDKSKTYSLSEALELLEKMQRKSFDETVELHINTSDPKVSGQTSLPHGTGKKIRVAIATDELLAEIEKGKISFDILLADPQMMPKLAKVAKVLGPRGLMPNPKNGTITQNPEEAAKKYEGGLVFFKTESKAPIIHLSVGKISFGKDKLTENIKTLFDAIKKENIQKAVLKSTMSPAIKLVVDKS
ncbi:MAG TPA: hypothetical protein VFA93_00130 [Patescibacteria group bacterium]|nr:hypothetical protein [Patescibacteria group bacterium]